jgi:uncharacterized protein involved in cysteine biosynthesis
MRAAAGSPPVRRAYRLLVFAIAAVTLLFVTGGIYAVVRLTVQSPGNSWPVSLALLTLRILGSAFVLLASPLFALFFLNTVTPLLTERVFLAGLRVLDPEEAEALRSAPGSSLLAVLTGSSRRLFRLLCLTVLVSPLSLVPIAGPVLGPLVEFGLTTVMLGWELLDPYFDKRGLPYAAQLAYVRRNWSTLLGFAVPYTLLLAIPVIGPFFFGIAQAATAALVTDIVEPEIARQVGRTLRRRET